MTFSVHYICKLSHRLGFVHKHVPGKADPKKQAEFVAEYGEFLEKADENEVFYFGDGCHTQHNNVLAFVDNTFALSMKT